MQFAEDHKFYPGFLSGCKLKLKEVPILCGPHCANKKNASSLA